MVKQASQHQTEFNENYAAALNLDRSQSRKGGVYTSGMTIEDTRKAMRESLPGFADVSERRRGQEDDVRVTKSLRPMVRRMPYLPMNPNLPPTS